jgi:hypothetical protein
VRCWKVRIVGPPLGPLPRPCVTGCAFVLSADLKGLLPSGLLTSADVQAIARTYNITHGRIVAESERKVPRPDGPRYQLVAVMSDGVFGRC